MNPVPFDGYMANLSVTYSLYCQRQGDRLHLDAHTCNDVEGICPFRREKSRTGA